MVKILYAEIAGITTPLNISINSNHSNATAIATITCENTSLDIGDAITIDLGYEDNHDVLFRGWIKGVEKVTPDNVYTITANDSLVQAIDYFLVSQSPESPYNFGKGISAEALVAEVLELAGLSIYAHDDTHFEFGVNNDVEVNLVSAYDYARMIADIVTWSLWADRDGRIYFKNRKPFVMGSEDYGQIGWHEDVPINPTPYNDLKILDYTYRRSEKELRNRVVVYGEEGIKSDKSQGTSWDALYDGGTGGYIQVLPAGFYKSVVVSYGFIGDQSLADDIAQYNLDSLNRVTLQCSVVMEGDPILEARKVITIEEPITGIPNSDWYIYDCTHTWGKDTGYTTSMELRK